MERHQFFKKALKLIKSAESNYQHGRSYQGQKKLTEAHDLIRDFLGDNL